MIAGRISYKYIIEKLYRDLGISEEIPEFDIIEWISEALAFIGAFGQYESKTVILTVENHTAKLPAGFYRLQDIMANNRAMHWAGNSLISNWCCEDCKIPTCNDNMLCEQTFYIDNYCLHTTLSNDSKVCITYLSIPVDEQGYPTVPDDVYYFEACKMYVTKQLDWQNWRKGRIPDKVKDDSQMKWDFYVQSARGAANMPSLAELERLKDRIIRIIPQQSAYNQFFRGGQEQKYIK